LAIDAIVSLTAPPAAAFAAPSRPVAERRSRARDHERSREVGRAIEFASFAAIGLLASAAAVAVLIDALAEPLMKVRAALGS
jgi:hypothetical protein